MSKAKIFATNQLLEKSLKGYRPTLQYGDRLEMYKNIYKVIQFQDKGYTILEDEKKAQVAYPTNALRILMKNKECLQLGTPNSITKGPSEPVKKAIGSRSGVTSGTVSAAYNKQSSGAKGGSQPRGEPVGTVRTGKDGQQYKKTSASPSTWVRVASGSVHHSPGGEEQDPMSVSAESRHQFQRMMTSIESKVHPSDRPKIQAKAQEWIKENAKFKHMQSAHNTHEVDDKGKKMPKQPLATSTLSNVYAQGDKARKARQQLIDLVKESHLKLRSSKNAK